MSPCRPSQHAFRRAAVPAAFAIALLSGASATAQDNGTATLPASTVAAQVRPGSYVVEPTHTQIEFSVLHFGFTHYWGAFSNVSGTLTLDPQNITAASLSVTIPIASVQTTSTTLDGELKGADWFDSAKFPNATFESTSVRRVSERTAIVSGKLTIHGVTKPETLLVHFLGAGVNPIDKKYTVGFDATTTVKRSDFGVTKYVPYVGDEVRLVIAGAFEKQD